jgi:integrase
MARKRYKPEEIVAKLRQVDVLVSQGQGLRASEVCDLQWPQIELESGRMHVRTAKNGRPSVYPIRGDEIRALRGLRHENPTAAHAFVTERGGPMSTIGFHHLIRRLGEANDGHDTRALQALPRAQEHPAHGEIHRAKSRQI